MWVDVACHKYPYIYIYLYLSISTYLSIYLHLSKPIHRTYITLPLHLIIKFSYYIIMMEYCCCIAVALYRIVFFSLIPNIGSDRAPASSQGMLLRRLHPRPMAGAAPRVPRAGGLWGLGHPDPWNTGITWNPHQNNSNSNSNSNLNEPPTLSPISWHCLIFSERGKPYFRPT